MVLFEFEKLSLFFSHQTFLLETQLAVSNRQLGVEVIYSLHAFPVLLLHFFKLLLFLSNLRLGRLDSFNEQELAILRLREFEYFG